MTERLVITRIAHRGDGVADTPNGPVYVPYTLPGETVEVEPVAGHPDRRHLLHVDVASPERVPPICQHFGVCGGCVMQHWMFNRYCEWKRALVTNALRRSGLDVPVNELIDAHGEGRRRATFHARRGARDVIEVGFSALRAHRIVAIDRCPILAPSLANAVRVAWTIAEVLEPQRKPLDIQVTATEGGLDIDVRGSGALSPALAMTLARLADSHGLARLTRHGELIAQRVPPTVTIGRARVVLPPGAFLQATLAGEETLARLVATGVGNAGVIADLFCGLGPFALRLAERAHISAFDAAVPAIAALKQAAGAAPGLKPIAATARDLFRRPLLAQELKPFEAVVFDPPRQGAEAQAREIARSSVPIVVAVSCNPSTFVRDARILVDGGYRLAAVTPIDQFRYSAHVEIVARLER